MSRIPLIACFEDALTESLFSSINREIGFKYQVVQTLPMKGRAYIEGNASRLLNTARSFPTIVACDLDTDKCAPIFVRQIFGANCPVNLIATIAVRAAESWVLADRTGVAGFLGIMPQRISPVPDDLLDPKTILLSLVRSSRRNNLKLDLLPSVGSTSKVGPAYNPTMSQFIDKTWNCTAARKNSKSLDRAITKLLSFESDIRI